MDRLRIAYVSPRYDPYIGGVEYVVKSLAERLATLDHSVTVYTRDPSNLLPKIEKRNHVMVKRYPCLASSGIQHLLGRETTVFLLKEQPSVELVLDLLEDHPNIVHIHDIHDLTSLILLFALKFVGDCKVVMTPHYHGGGHDWLTAFLWNVGRPIVGELLRKIDLVQAVSNWEKRLIQNDFAVSRDKLCIIPHGVDEDLLNYRWEPPKDRIRLIYAGRLARYKRVSLIVRSIPLILKRYDEVELTIVGHGPEENSLRRLVRKTGVQNHIHFLDFLSREQYLKEISQSTALVNVSEKEAFGLTVYEALSMGVPAIISKSAALVEYTEYPVLALPMNPTPLEIASAAYMITERVKSAGFKKLFPTTWAEVAKRLLIIYAKLVLT